MPYLLITQQSQLIELISNLPQVYNIKQVDEMLTGGLEEQLISSSFRDNNAVIELTNAFTQRTFKVLYKFATFWGFFSGL